MTYHFVFWGRVHSKVRRSTSVRSGDSEVDRVEDFTDSYHNRPAMT